MPDSAATRPGSCSKQWGWGQTQAGLPDHLQQCGKAGTRGCSSLLFLHKITPSELANPLFCSSSAVIAFCGDTAFPPARHLICAIATDTIYVQNRPKLNQSTDRNKCILAARATPLNNQNDFSMVQSKSTAQWAIRRCSQARVCSLPGGCHPMGYHPTHLILTPQGSKGKRRLTCDTLKSRKLVNTLGKPAVAQKEVLRYSW